jgi:hypothetical protein
MAFSAIYRIKSSSRTFRQYWLIRVSARSGHLIGNDDDAIGTRQDATTTMRYLPHPDSGSNTVVPMPLKRSGLVRSRMLDEAYEEPSLRDHTPCCRERRHEHLIDPTRFETLNFPAALS